ncbi:hypothetical protein Taro_052002 [Colocasia esculenta]|uniref:MAR-binding filament-like protein 1-1 n=1 Tax=Colocasia esculenta TaxID=4460 RepID=A0A843XID3_COLES|nr:hypothetical protein [Colocasia esculenta]
MGYCVLLGSSRFLHSPLFQSFSLFSLPPPPRSFPGVVYYHREAHRRKPTVPATASLRPEGPGSDNRRVLLLVGLSAFPLLQLRALAAAVQGLGKEKQDIKITDVQGPHVQDSPSYLQQKEAEQAHAHRAPESPFLSLLNGLGIIGSGVLGALYAISQKEKADVESEIESMNNNLNENEAAKALLEKNFEQMLLKEQEEHQKQIKKLKEDEASLSKQLALAKTTVTALGNELQSEKRSAEEFKLQIDQLHGNITQAGEDKKILESKLQDKLNTVGVLQEKVSLLSLEIKDKEESIGALKSSLDEKETLSKYLGSLIDQSKVELEESNSVLSSLQLELFKIKGELDSKNTHINDMNIEMNLFCTERDEIDGKFHILQKEYDDLKLNFEQKSAFNSELLSRKDEEVHQLEEKLCLALTEGKNKYALITDLKNERDSISAMLNEEINNVKVLRDELQITHENLRNTKLVVSDLSEQMQESNKVHEELLSEVTSAKGESSKLEKLLNAYLREEQSTSELLSDELAMGKEVLASTKEELAMVSDELKVAEEACENLKKELLEVYDKVEAMGHELKEERKVVAAHNRELEESKRLVSKHSEVRMNLEKHLDETTKSLDKMNKEALSLSKELQNANVQNATLESEKETLYLSLMEQKNLTKEAEENLEDAQHVIQMLGADRGNLEKAAKKFENELSSAKGEILRLRRQIKLSKESTNEHHERVNNIEADASVTSTKNGLRRRESGSASQVSDEET